MNLHEDLRVDEEVASAYEKAWLESQVYYCDCIDKVECYRCSNQGDE